MPVPPELDHSHGDGLSFPPKRRPALDPTNTTTATSHTNDRPEESTDVHYIPAKQNRQQQQQQQQKRTLHNTARAGWLAGNQPIAWVLRLYPSRQHCNKPTRRAHQFCLPSFSPKNSATKHLLCSLLAAGWDSRSRPERQQQ